MSWRAKSLHFGARSTADQVIAGVDLSTKVYLVTGCDSGIGLATLQALAANGATVIGLARTLAKAAAACAVAGPCCKPVGCDLADLTSVRTAVDAVLRLELTLDGVLANAGLAGIPSPQSRYGVDMHFLVNYLAHSALIDQLLERVRDGAGRIVVTGSRAGVNPTVVNGIDFLNLDGGISYQPWQSYSQSKFALALYAKHLARRLAGRGITVNTAEPRRTKHTAIDRHRMSWSLHPLWRWMLKTPAQGAATQTLLLASPSCSGITGELWRDCHIVDGHPLLEDGGLAERLREVSQHVVEHAGAANSRSFKVAA